MALPPLELPPIEKGRPVAGRPFCVPLQRANERPLGTPGVVDNRAETLVQGVCGSCCEGVVRVGFDEKWMRVVGGERAVFLHAKKALREMVKTTAGIYPLRLRCAEGPAR